MKLLGNKKGIYSSFIPTEYYLNGLKYSINSLLNIIVINITIYLSYILGKTTAAS